MIDKKRREKKADEVLQTIKNKKKDKKTLTYDDMMDCLVLEVLMPTLYAGFQKQKEHIKKKSHGGMVHIKNLTDSYNMTMAFLSVLEPQIEQHIKRIIKNGKTNKAN